MSELSLSKKDDNPVPPHPLALSPSKIDTLNCPHRYREIYVNGRDEGSDQMALALGSLAHLVAADYMNYLQEKDRQTDHGALDLIAQKRWRTRDAAVGVECYDDFQLFCDSLREFSVKSPTAIIAVEGRIAFDAKWDACAWESPSTAFGGIIDFAYIDGDVLKIRDWTTASLAGWFSTKKDLQLRMYALLAYRKWHFDGAECWDSIEVTAHSLRTNTQRTVRLTKEDHKETLDRILAERSRLRGMLENPDYVWEATPCQQCSICRIECPALEGALKLAIPLRIEDKDQALNLHQQLILLDRRRKGIVGVLKSYCGIHGPITQGGLRAGFVSRIERSYPAYEVFEMLTGAGIREVEAWDVMKVDKAKLHRATKQDKTLREDVDGLEVRREKERFEALQSAKDEPVFGEGGDDE